MEGGAVQVITLWQIVAILYFILRCNGNQSNSTRRGVTCRRLADKTSSGVHHTLNLTEQESLGRK